MGEDWFDNSLDIIGIDEITAFACRPCPRNPLEEQSRARGGTQQDLIMTAGGLNDIDYVSLYGRSNVNLSCDIDHSGDVVTSNDGGKGLEH